MLGGISVLLNATGLEHATEQDLDLDRELRHGRLHDVVALGRCRGARQGGDGAGVVPPDLAGDGPEELEGGDHALEHGLGPLEGQGQGGPLADDVGRAEQLQSKRGP